MNILVIGNGFDLAHGLPTKYADFLLWIVGEYDFFYKLKEQKAQITDSREGIFLKMPNGLKGTVISQRVCCQQEVWECIDNNIWVEYFLSIYKDREKVGKNGWIDFESEISQVIKSLDDDMNLSISQHLILDDKIKYITNEFLNCKYIDWFAKKTYRELRDVLLNDLNRLIRVFEIYLCEYVEKIEIRKKSQSVEELKIDHVLSFNYTHTFSRLYKIAERIGKSDLAIFDYIHGEAKIENSIESNNMVLGIDEYLPKDRQNTEIEFIAFKKYYQRIYKETGSKYKEWLDIIKKDERELKEKFKNVYPIQVPFKKCIGKHHNLYIFGHSLDITDKDILRDLILNDNIKTTIFYRNKEELGRKIANLVKIIHQDELIRRTGGSTKTIYFELQK